MQLSDSDKSRFWAKVNKTDTCWLWTGYVQLNGYGQFGFNKRVLYVHRVSYALHMGEIPDGAVVDHLCHTRHCVKPEHLRAITQKQNTENLQGARQRTSSGIRGVYWHKASKKWSAEVKHNYKRHYLGLFSSVVDAESAAIEKRNELFTHNDRDKK